jgi:mono/diheme cytochrome c family protein
LIDYRCGDLFLHADQVIFPQSTDVVMSFNRRFFNKALATLSVLFLISLSHTALAQDGASLFKTYCASCHKPDKEFTGPPLKGARDREPSRDWVYKWVANPQAMINTDPYAKSLFEKYGSVMTPFPDLKKEEIDAILDWSDNYTSDTGGGAAEGGPGGKASSTDGADNNFLFGVLTLILAIVGLILLQINSNLKKLADDKEGVRRGQPVPFYRNKAYLMIAIIFLFLLGGYLTTDALTSLGRQTNYQPTQPIYFSHQVHAGVNQISCLYCHGSAQDSKHANFPSVNVCMNCHLTVSDYTGQEIVKEDGKSVNGTAEIQKLYDYAGFNPATKKFDRPAKEIPWVRIHNLPDHVYFNHAQHVKVGQQHCQTCHGNIQEMPEVYQFSDLSMGWCINCHRETKVQFNDAKGGGNKFYSIYEKFHDDIKNKKYDSVTVESIGGTECQKCHY